MKDAITKFLWDCNNPLLLDINCQVKTTGTGPADLLKINENFVNTINSM